MRVVFLGKVGYFFLGEFFLFLGKEDIINIRESFLGWGYFGLWGRMRLGGGLWVVGTDAVRDWSPSHANGTTFR